MKTKLLILTGTLLMSLTAFAGEEANVKVKGMVCSFCATGIKKKLNSESAVSSVEVNLDEKWVKIGFKVGQSLADDKIKSLITDAGYNVVSIDRSGQAPASDRKIAEAPAPKK